MNNLWYRLFICPKRGHYFMPIYKNDIQTEKSRCMFCEKKRKTGEETTEHETHTAEKEARVKARKAFKKNFR